MAESLGMENPTYVPLISSENVVSQLRLGDIDYGVVAVKNNIGGRVQETFEAIRDEELELVRTTILDIHHCVFKLSATPREDLTHIASHTQALLQTQATRASHFYDLEEIEIADTAIGASMLASGQLPADFAIICPKGIGLEKGLELIAENIEDTASKTEFRMYKLPPEELSEDASAQPADRLIHGLITQDGLGTVAKAIMILGIAGVLVLAGGQFLDTIDVAMTIAGVISAVFLYLTSNQVRNFVRYRPLEGFWKYYAVPDKGHEADVDMLYETPRIVKIEEIDGALYLKGWLCDRALSPFFESRKTVVSDSDKAQGCLVYWYQDPLEVGRGLSLNGTGELNWLKRDPAAKVNRMRGTYHGLATGETGRLVFHRIAEEEFNVHRNCQFLGHSLNEASHRATRSDGTASRTEAKG